VDGGCVCLAKERHAALHVIEVVRRRALPEERIAPFSQERVDAAFAEEGVPRSLAEKRCPALVVVVVVQ